MADQKRTLITGGTVVLGQTVSQRDILVEEERTISMTMLDGKTVLRLVVISPHVTREALIETISAVRTLAGKVRKERTIVGSIA